VRQEVQGWDGERAREREERNCAWEAGTEARVPGGGVRGAQAADWLLLLLQGGRGLVGPGHQSAEAAQAVPQAPGALALRRSALATPSPWPQEDNNNTTPPRVTVETMMKVDPRTQTRGDNGGGGGK